MVEYSSRAHSSSVECIHGMDEGGVQFPVGPHFILIFIIVAYKRLTYGTAPE